MSVKVGSGDEWNEPDEWEILFSISDENVSVVEKTSLEGVAGVEALELEGDAREDITETESGEEETEVVVRGGVEMLEQAKGAIKFNIITTHLY